MSLVQWVRGRGLPSPPAFLVVWKIVTFVPVPLLMEAFVSLLLYHLRQLVLFLITISFLHQPSSYVRYVVHIITHDPHSYSDIPILFPHPRSRSPV